LRQKLDTLQYQPIAEQYKQVTVLAADLSVNRAGAAPSAAEDSGDALRVLWKRLEGVIDAWDGVVEEEPSNGLIALFGTSISHMDDPERAILAALDMQMEVALFNEGAAKETSSRSGSSGRLQMRIGIDSGQVFLGNVGKGGGYLALGEAARIAVWLQQRAPVGRILISHEVYSQVRALFEADSSEPLVVEGKIEPIGVYEIREDRPDRFQAPIHLAGMEERRMVGRQAELEQLQLALQTTMDAGVAQFLLIEGEAGVGKSRLLHEFRQMLKLSPMRVEEFSGHAQRESGQLPYALMHDLFSNSLGIHSRSSSSIAREKLIRGLAGNMGEGREDVLEHAGVIGHLLGFDFSHSDYLEEAINDSHLLRELARNSLVKFFTAVALRSSVIVLILEDVHWADERSLDMIDHLFQRCRDLPLLFICSRRPTPNPVRPSWPSVDYGNSSRYQKLELASLSTVDCHHVIAGVSKGAARMPLRLIDLIVDQTGGNPSYIKELTDALTESGAIVKEANQWRLQLETFQHGQKLPAIKKLLQFQFQQLSSPELETLKRASVLGRVFWRSAVVQMADNSEPPSSGEQVDHALISLERRGFIYHHSATSFRGLQEYVFRSDRLRTVTYEGLAESERRRYHAQAATWLITNSAPHVPDYSHVIAGHFHRAGELTRAARWYGRAGTSARRTHAPDTAISHFRRALRLSSRVAVTSR
jgi:class 3 adenylate cyclase